MNEIVIYFSSNPTKEYQCVNGAIFNEEFSETLDSAVIVLDNITNENRLNDLSPYEYVKVANKGVSTPFTNRFYLVDNYVEKETNINKHIFQYTINLMSETKLLEKIQCPNLVITHSKVYGKKYIYEYIDQYMQLYCPKVKIRNEDGTWKYDYLIKWDLDKLMDKFFVECADMSLSLPTLRQLLTSLMTQVGCIPVVKNRELTWIDFNEEQPNFIKHNSMNYIQKSLSSDSYINALVNNYNQVLDTSNVVVSEKIGFRKRDSVVLQQLDNLTIETKFPIYEISKFVLKLEKPIDTTLRAVNTNDYSINGFNGIVSYYPDITEIKFSVKNSRTFLLDKMYFYVSNKTGQSSTESRHNCIIKNLEINVCKKTTTKLYNQDVVSYKNIGKITLFTNGVYLNAPPYDYNKATEYIITNGYVESTKDLDSYTARGYWYKIENIEISVSEDISSSDVIAIWMKDELIDKVTEEHTTQFVPFVEKVGEYYPYEKALVKRFYSYQNIDITQLIVENSKRNLLSRNYNEMANATTLEELSQYVYGTIGYSIGTKQISGFSQTYSIPTAWWTSEHSIFENIISFLMKNDLYYEEDVDFSILNKSIGGVPQEYYETNIYEVEYQSGFFNFATFIFDIEYQPLNSYNLKYVKEVNDIPFLLEQLDNSDNGVVDFDRTSLNEQEKINRLGNDVLSINQLTKDVNEIQPLNSLYGDYTIFKRTIAVENNLYLVNYYASKNYVMKNYFTSITTKYRAYENVDYNQSVIRKENQTLFVYIGENYIDSNYDMYVKNLDTSLLVSGMTNYESNDKNVNYSYEKDNGKSYKNDVSVITANNLIAFIYENYDNASIGQYLQSYEVNKNVAGILTGNYMYSDEYYISHEVGFINSFEIYNQEDVAKLPLIREGYTSIFNLVDDNKSDSLQRAFYKDNAEIINQSVQFIYYTDSDNVIWTNLFIENNKLCDKIEKKPNAVIDITGQEFKITDKSYNYLGDIISENIDDFITISENKITIDWTKLNGITQFKISNITTRPRAIFKATIDFIAFRKGKKDIQEFYFGLNDTKTLKIYNTIKDGLNKDLIYLE